MDEAGRIAFRGHAQWHGDLVAGEDFSRCCARASLSFHSVDALTLKSITLRLIRHRSPATTVIIGWIILRTTRGLVITAERITTHIELAIGEDFQPLT